MFLSKEEYAANKDGLFLTTSRYSQRHCDPAECGGSDPYTVSSLRGAERRSNLTKKHAVAEYSKAV